MKHFITMWLLLSISIILVFGAIIGVNWVIDTHPIVGWSVVFFLFTGIWAWIIVE